MTIEDDKETQAPVARDYDLRLVSRHDGEENAMVDLEVELRRAGEDWESLPLSADGSPYLNFLHAAFTCQLAYIRMNAAERGLRLRRVHGSCSCGTLDFAIHRFRTSFALELDAGEVSDEDLAWFRERCLACPVSRNLLHVTDKDATVAIAAAG